MQTMEPHPQLHSFFVSFYDSRLDFTEKFNEIICQNIDIPIQSAKMKNVCIGRTAVCVGPPQKCVRRNLYEQAPENL